MNEFSLKIQVFDQKYSKIVKYYDSLKLQFSVECNVFNSFLSVLKTVVLNIFVKTVIKGFWLESS